MQTTLDNPMLRPSLAERESEKLAQRQAAQQELMGELFIDAISSGHDITMSVGQSSLRYPLSELLGEPSKANAKLLFAACAEAMKPAEPSYANDAKTARLLRDFVRAMADEYANDFDASGD